MRTLVCSTRRTRRSVSIEAYENGKGGADFLKRNDVGEFVMLVVVDCSGFMYFICNPDLFFDDFVVKSNQSSIILLLPASCQQQ
jgi:hypothetical protein